MMATDLGAVPWQKPPGSERIHSYYESAEEIVHSNNSFLHSQKLKRELSESRKAFLSPIRMDEDYTNSVSRNASDNGSMKNNNKINVTKKISFKIKKSSSVHRRIPITRMTNNKVAELTQKFDGIISSENNTGNPPITNSLDNSRKVRLVTRKPSVKTKPNLDDTKLVVVRKKLKNDLNNKVIRARIGFLEVPHILNEQNRPSSLPGLVNDIKEVDEKPTPCGSVRAAIEIFERRSCESSPTTQPLLTNNVPKIKTPQNPANNKVPDDNNVEESDKTDFDLVQIVNMPAILPQRRCDSMYETMNLRKVSPDYKIKVSKSEEAITNRRDANIKPNTSFLWRDKSPSTNSNNNDDWKDLYDFVDPKVGEMTEIPKNPQVPPRPASLPFTKAPTLPPKKLTLRSAPPPPMEEKIYEELNNIREEDTVSHSYEYCENSTTEYEIISHPHDNPSDDGKVVDDGYEYCASPDKEENIYEVLPTSRNNQPQQQLPPPLLPRRQQQEPLPPRPPSRSSRTVTPTINSGEEIMSNCYESIYNSSSNKNTSSSSITVSPGCNEDIITKGVNKEVDNESTYESIYGCHINNRGSNRNSVVSSDQQSNSLYGRGGSVWGDDGLNLGGALYTGKACSDLSSSDRSDDWVDVTDNEDNDANSSGIIIVRERLKMKKSSGWSRQFREQWSKSPRKVPPLADQGIDSDTDHHYESLRNSSLSREIAHDDDYDSFDSDTESETSFQRVHLSDSGVDIANSQLPEPPNGQPYGLTRLAATAGKHMRKLRRNWSLKKNDISKSLSRMTKRKSRTDLDINVQGGSEAINPTNESIIPNIPPTQEVPNDNSDQKKNSLTRKSLFNKFRRSMSLSVESATELTSNLDGPKSTFYLTEEINLDDESTNNDTTKDSGIVATSPTKKRSPPGSIKRPQSPPPPAPVNNRNRSKATSWYAEVGLFKNSDHNKSRPNTTFWYAEVGLYNDQNNANSGSTPSTSSAETYSANNSEEYYNVKNSSTDESVRSFSSGDTKTGEVQLRLQDEPLYQFYDAAVLESVCHEGVSDLDSDGYEEVGDSATLTSRPSAMELVSPRNSLAIARTLWCEIPEVVRSATLNSMSAHQKKLQEAKFEMLTSEASYLNSLHVLDEHFVAGLAHLDVICDDDLKTLFGEVAAVKNCSEKLLLDLEKCWQDNILLHGVCDIVQKHAEENFQVYVDYCENQILIDDTLKKIKERPGFLEILRQLESSSTCQSLTLYSFLMLPMQRITRWPLLVDAVLKRLSPQDSEYLTCQYALATLSKVANQCNEAARRKERETEMKKLASQLEFSKGVPRVEVVSENRFLIRSGAVTQMQMRTDEIKLTFGKRFVKSPLHLFLFNDLLFVTKAKSDNNYSVIHYCPRNLVELNSTESVPSLPVKDAQSRHLVFLTLLENQHEKTVELLLSCSSESDKERWIEALSQPKSDDPNETLYECWDCPQVTALHSYSASQPDELAMSRGDVINVLRKMADGWYHGERIRDGQTGWFPANYTAEIANPHVRSRNLKQRYRLLAFSVNYLKTK